MTKVMNVALLLHNFIVEHRRSDYESDLFEDTEKVVVRCRYTYSNGELRPLAWNGSRKLKHGLEVPLSDIEW